MFRSKMLSILQNTLNRNLYNNGHASICALFSSNTSNATVTETSAGALNETVSGASTEIVSEALKETSNKKLTDILTEASKQAVVTNKSSDETSSTSTSTSENSEPDKLYKKVEVEVRGNDPAVLHSYVTFSTIAANHLELTVGRVYAPDKPHHKRITVLKSVHVHKKHRVQYENRTYYKYFELFNLTGSTADTYLEYIQRNLPEGVAMKVTKVELHILPESVRQASLSQ